MQVHTVFFVSPLSRVTHSSYPTACQSIEKAVFKLHFIPFFENLPIRAGHSCYLVFCVVLCGGYLAIGGCCECLDSVYETGDDFSLSRLESTPLLCLGTQQFSENATFLSSEDPVNLIVFYGTGQFPNM